MRAVQQETRMTITMHSASAPIFVKMLENVLRWLDKAQAHAESRRFDSANYLGLRLAPDMLPFTKQIQIASDSAKACMARLAGEEVPKWDDNEKSLDDLRARIRKTIDYVKSVQPAQVDGSETRKVSVPVRNGEPLQFDGQAYLAHYALPNFFFHVGMTYALLRQAGVDLGKADYLAVR